MLDEQLLHDTESFFAELGIASITVSPRYCGEFLECPTAA